MEIKINKRSERSEILIVKLYSGLNINFVNKKKVSSPTIFILNHFLKNSLFLLLLFFLQANAQNVTWLNIDKQPCGYTGGQMVVNNQKGIIYFVGANYSSSPDTGCKKHSSIYLDAYDMSGGKLWHAKTSGWLWTSDIALDSTGNIYICGTCQDNVRFDTLSLSNSKYPGNEMADAYLVKYNPQGIPLWARRIESLWGIDQLNITVDPQGDVYVCGISGNV